MTGATDTEDTSLTLWGRAATQANKYAGPVSAAGSCWGVGLAFWANTKGPLFDQIAWAVVYVVWATAITVMTVSVFRAQNRIVKGRLFRTVVSESSNGGLTTSATLSVTAYGLMIAASLLTGEDGTTRAEYLTNVAQAFGVVVTTTAIMSAYSSLVYRMEREGIRLEHRDEEVV